jgi:hypothetical protein
VEARQHGRQPGTLHRGDGPDAQPHGAAIVLRRRAQAGELLQQCLGLGQQLGAAPVQVGRAAGALEQREAQMGLQPLHLRAHRRLGQADAVPAAAKEPAWATATKVLSSRIMGGSLAVSGGGRIVPAGAGPAGLA